MVGFPTFVTLAFLGTTLQPCNLLEHWPARRMRRTGAQAGKRIIPHVPHQAGERRSTQSHVQRRSRRPASAARRPRCRPAGIVSGRASGGRSPTTPDRRSWCRTGRLGCCCCSAPRCDGCRRYVSKSGFAFGCLDLFVCVISSVWKSSFCTRN